MALQDIERFVLFYNNEFLPAYSDLVGYITAKPQEVLISLEHSFSHVMQYNTVDLLEDTREENLKKAHHHLQRATLDCYKLFWVEMDRDLKSLVNDQYKRKFCVNMSEGDLLISYSHFKTAAQEARQTEARNIGVNYLETINAYKKACEHGKQIFKNIDDIKMADLDKIRVKIWKFVTAKEFVTGLIAGLISSFIVYFITK
ncbi:MAG: hypothetical protein NTV68_05295 [Methanomicrobiales archaeon]|nr:hypothetical protein [Methanomicrobiales archaeon]